MEIQDSDITVVGHLSIDNISLPNRPHPVSVLGGSAAYSSLAAKRLDATVSVISKVGGDFPQAYMWWLQQEGIDITNVTRVEEEQTTRFEIKYNEDLTNRKLKLISKAPPITVADLPKTFHSKAVHIAPIANETPYETISKLKKSADIVSLDPQGIMRSYDKDGNATYKSTISKRTLSLINIWKSSTEELNAATGHKDTRTAIKAIHNYGIDTVIITQGAKGAILSISGTRYNIPPCKSTSVVDPTGAGDVFMSGFLTEYIRQKDSLWCACVGSAAASMVVEAVGPTVFGEKEEIHRRATAIYEKGIKQ
jgi:sugar/nucleoside kinase (ribokinase family)